MATSRNSQQKLSNRKTSSKATPSKAASTPVSALNRWIASFFATTRCTWNPLLVSLCVNVLFFGLTYSLYTPQFNTRDDTIMMLLAAGKIIALEPSPYLIHTNILIGYALNWLYTALPNGVWYALYLIAALFAAHVALLWAAVRHTRSWLAVGIFALYFALHGAYMLLSLQYTMVAILLAFGGMALLAITKDSEMKSSETKSSETKSRQRQGWKRFVSGTGLCGAILLAGAWMIRWKSCLLAVTVCAPLMLVDVLRFTIMQQDGRPFAQRFFVVAPQLSALIVAVLLCGAVHIFNTSIYETWGTGDFLKFNALREVLQDERPLQRAAMSYEQKRDAMRRVGWSEFDLEMFYNDFYMNDTLYNARIFEVFIKGLNEQEQTVQATRVAQQQDYIRTQVWQRERTTLVRWPVRHALAFFFVGCAVLMFAQQRYGVSLLKAASVLAAVLAASVYIHNLTLMRDAPERVLVPLFAVLWFAPLLSFHAGFEQTQFEQTPFGQASSPLRWVLACAALVASGFVLLLPANEERVAFAQYAAISRSAQDGEREWAEHLSALKPSSERLYVIWGNGFPMGSIAPFQQLRGLEAFHALWLSWCERTPTSRSMLDRYGVRDLYWDIATKDSIFVLLSLNQVREQTLMYHVRYEMYLNEHYKASVKGRSDAFRTLTRIPAGTTADPYRTYLEAKFRLQTLLQTAQYQDSGRTK
jgi:hypothetical protein